MPILTFDRILKIISTILSILATAIGALQNLDDDKETVDEK